MDIVVSVAKKNITPHIINPEVLSEKEGLDYERNHKLNEFIKISGNQDWMFWEMRDECSRLAWDDFLNGESYGSYMNNVVIGVLFMHRRTKEVVIVLYVR